VLEWEYRQLQIPLQCRQTDGVSSGLFTCMNTIAIAEQPQILLNDNNSRKCLKKWQDNQDKAPWWCFYLFYIIVLKQNNIVY
jgi:hypothetical protein